MPHKEDQETFPNKVVRGVYNFKLYDKERELHHYGGCANCPETWNAEPLYEIDIKGRTKYPHVPGRSTTTSSLSNESQMEACMDRIKAGITNLSDIDRASNVNIGQMEETIGTIEKVLSSFKTKFDTYKRSATESQQEQEEEEDTVEVQSSSQSTINFEEEGEGMMCEDDDDTSESSYQSIEILSPLTVRAEDFL